MHRCGIQCSCVGRGGLRWRRCSLRCVASAGSLLGKCRATPCCRPLLQPTLAKVFGEAGMQPREFTPKNPRGMPDLKASLPGRPDGQAGGRLHFLIGCSEAPEQPAAEEARQHHVSVVLDALQLLPPRRSSTSRTSLARTPRPTPRTGTSTPPAAPTRWTPSTSCPQPRRRQRPRPSFCETRWTSATLRAPRCAPAVGAAAAGRVQKQVPRWWAMLAWAIRWLTAYMQKCWSVRTPASHLGVDRF